MIWFPGRRRIAGECYEVSPLLLRRLDRFEQTPHDYRRRLVRTPLGLKLAERLVVYDSEMIPNSIIYPI